MHTHTEAQAEAKAKRQMDGWMRISHRPASGDLPISTWSGAAGALLGPSCWGALCWGSSAGASSAWCQSRLAVVGLGVLGSWGPGLVVSGSLGLLSGSPRGGLEGSLGRRCVVWGPALVPDGGLQRRPQDARPLCGWVWAGVGVGVPRLQGCLFAWECPGVWVWLSAIPRSVPIHARHTVCVSGVWVGC